EIAGLFDTLAAPRPISAALGIAPARIAAWRFELSGSIVAEAGDRDLDGRVSAGADRRWSAGDLVIAAGLGGYWQPSSTIAALPGFVSIDEVGARVALGIERSVDPVTLFARPNAALSVLFAEGTSNKGAQGSATVLSPNGVCVDGSCSPGCVMDGGTCTAHTDCCGGYCDPWQPPSWSCPPSVLHASRSMTPLPSSSSSPSTRDDVSPSIVQPVTSERPTIPQMVAVLMNGRPSAKYALTGIARCGTCGGAIAAARVQAYG